MTRLPKGNHSSAFKTKVELAALKGDKTMSELATQFDVHPNQIKQWKDRLLDGVAGVFDDSARPAKEPGIDVKSLHAKIGRHCHVNAPVSFGEACRDEQRFKSPGSAQGFLNIYSSVYNAFYVQRHLLNRSTFKGFRTDVFNVWDCASAAA